MERRAFLKNAGLTGLCSCFVARALAADSAAAPQPQPTPPEDWRINFARQRYSKLVSLVAGRVDGATFNQLVEDVGAFCADSGFAKQFKGQLPAYLGEMEKRWGAQTSFDQATNTAQVAFNPPNADCACPLMGKGLVPGAACHCSVGSMKRAFAVVTGQPVEVELKESVLQGGQRCAFAIRLARAT